MSRTPEVFKFGGSSLSDASKIRRVAEILARSFKAGAPIVAVVSAMGDTTDELEKLAAAVSPNSSSRASSAPYRREMDMLLSTGERTSMALVSMALADLGVSAVSFTGSQSGIITDEKHGEAKILEIKPTRIQEELARGKLVIVAGFQGVSRLKEITTLGRGGSDTTAVALAVCLGAESVSIFKDVAGLSSADPRKIAGTRAHRKIGWDSALIAAFSGAQILHRRCIELAWKSKLPIQIHHTFSEDPNLPALTTIEGVDAMTTLEGPQPLTLTVQKNLAEIEGPLVGVKIDPSSVAEKGVQVLGLVADETKYRLLVSEEQSSLLGDEATRVTRGLARVTLAGIGLMGDLSVVSSMRQAFLEKGLRPRHIETHPLSISMVIEAGPLLDDVVQKLHEHFFGKESAN